MSDHTHIEWTDATWNPVTGCSVVSPGCTNCYAMRLAGARLQHHPSRAGLTQASKAGPVWTGEVRFNPQWLDQPLRWRRPRRIFVCAHGDLFHERVPDAWIDQVFAVMALAPQHQFQVLTKRAARMRAYLSDPKTVRRTYEIVCDRVVLERRPFVLIAPGVRDLHAPPGPRIYLHQWPLPNVWAGVSAEDQTRADERIPELLATPAAVRFVSLEPLIGPVDLTRALSRFDYCPEETEEVPAHLQNGEEACQGCNGSGEGDCRAVRTAGLDWVIVGGENGTRPMHPDLVRPIRDACAVAGVPFFLKQWGSYAWAERVEGDPSTLTAYRVGKAAAGRALDGLTHDAMPEVAHG